MPEPFTGYPPAPPTPPPSESPVAPTPPFTGPPGAPGAPRPGSGSAKAAFGGAVATVALIAGGFGLARLTEEDPAPVTVPTADPGDQPATSPVVDPGVAGDPEPVVAIAEAVSPSVVQLETGRGLGSGFVYDDQGHVLTAAHVVQGVEELSVRVADGEVLSGRVVGTDPTTDVAVVEVEGGDLAPLDLADSSAVQVGQLAVAVGSPFGLDQTVTAGIVSAVGRTVQTPGGSISMVQTDAPINQGNSGGALVDREGRVIGINDAIVGPAGGNVGVGFAIPISTAAQVAEKLVAGEPIEYPVLGVSGSDLPAGPGGAGDGGTVVIDVTEGSGAEQAGIERGDRILAIDGEPVDGISGLQAEVLSRRAGDEVELTVERDGTEETVTVTLGAQQRSG